MSKVVNNPQESKENNETVTKKKAKAVTTKESAANKSADENPKQDEQAPLKVSADAANNFLNIIDVIMIGDPRGQSIMTHFQNMMVSQNPELKQQSPQE